MQITFSYPAGQSVVADVVTVGANYMRLIDQRRGEGLRLYLQDEGWVTESGSTVRVESILLAEESRQVARQEARYYVA